MKNIKSKFVSLVVMGYAFTSLNASAQLNVLNSDFDSIGNDGFDMKSESDAISYVRNRPVLLNEYDDGSELSFSSNNDVEMYGENTPIGFNSAGLIIKSVVNENNTYANAEEISDIQVTTQDFPLWALSKYSDIEGIKSGIENIVVSKNMNGQPLSYEIRDMNENVLKLNTVDGNLQIS